MREIKSPQKDGKILKMKWSMYRGKAREIKFPDIIIEKFLKKIKTNFVFLILKFDCFI